jgi:hypothetical protein
MVSTENEMSMSLHDKSFLKYLQTKRIYIKNISDASKYHKVDHIAILFNYMINTKEIWRFHRTIIANQNYINILLNKISEFRVDTTVSISDHFRISSILENIEHRLDLFCSDLTKNQLCFNKLTHSTMLMCTMHTNIEITKVNKLKRICQRENYFPSDLISLISLYIYSK